MGGICCGCGSCCGIIKSSTTMQTIVIIKINCFCCGVVELYLPIFYFYFFIKMFPITQHPQKESPPVKSLLKASRGLQQME